VLGHDSATVDHEVSQQGKLTWRKVDEFIASATLMRRDVEFEIGI
jgi:hypothetical protein